MMTSTKSTNSWNTSLTKCAERTINHNAALREQAHKEEQKKERTKALQQARELARVEEEERSGSARSTRETSP